MSKINIVWDASMFDTYSMCPFKFNIRYNRNLVPPVTAKPLDRGQIIHAGEEQYWLGLKEHKPWETCVDNALVVARFALNISDIDDVAEGNAYIDALEGSFHHWKIEDLSYIIGEVEQPFSYVLYEDDNFRIVMIGKVDLVVSNNQYNNLPIDHKSFERDYGAKRHTNQFINYANAVDSYYLLVNRIGVYAKSSKKKPEERYKRVPLSYDPAYIESWKANTVMWAMKYYQSTVENTWERNLTSCDKFNRNCEYLEMVCDVSGEENKEFKLMTYFKKTEQWDVSKSLRKTSEIVKDVQEGKDVTYTKD